MQFLCGLNSENKLEMKCLRLNRPLNNELIETLEEIKKQKNDILYRVSDPMVFKPASVPAQISATDIERIINARVAAVL